VAQSEDPEFKPQYGKTKTKTKQQNKNKNRKP
jgi:hypothetical protein